MNGQPQQPQYGGGQQPPYGQPQGQYGQAQPQQPAYSQPPQQPYGQPAQPQPSYGQPAQPNPFGQPAQPNPFGQPAPQQPYGQAPQGQYGQAPQSPYGQPPYGQSPSQVPAAPPSHGVAGGFGMPGMGAFGGLAGAGLGKAGAALPQLSGMPPVVAFGLGLAAVVVALVFDVIFLHVHIPGVGGYAWYLTTALSFAGAGYFGIKWTRATQATAMMSVVGAGILYGLADLGLGLVLEDIGMGSALFLGIQGVVIACVCGGGGVKKALSERG